MTDKKFEHIDMLEEEDAIPLAYSKEIRTVASFLEVGMSVLLFCDKILESYVYDAVSQQTGLRPVLPVQPMERNSVFDYSYRQINAIGKALAHLKNDEFLILSGINALLHVDSALSLAWSQEFIQHLYQHRHCKILAFMDSEIDLPDTLINRFARLISISCLPEHISHPALGERIPLMYAFLTREEAGKIHGLTSDSFFRNVAGMNPVRLRQAIAFATNKPKTAGKISSESFYELIRQFKVQSSVGFTVPDVCFERDIGGYEDVKRTVRRILSLLKRPQDYRGAENIQKNLLPGGFLFYGKPGTGKTLFAKAIANELHAAIHVVSGPEVVDKYVGESEKRIRQLFSEARSNAPAVIVFEEFDSIAQRRSGDSGGGAGE